MRTGPLGRVGALMLSAVAIGGLTGCGSGDPEEEPSVAFYMGGIAQIDSTVCAAETERSEGTNVVTVRDHERHYLSSVVRHEPGQEDEAREIARRLSITQVTPMDPVTPTLFPDVDVAVIIGGDYRCDR